MRDSGVRRVVFLSSVGAGLAEGNGPIACLHDQEQRLRAIAGVNLVQAGLSASVARTITELARAINEGRVRSQSTGAAGRMSTRFEDFAEELSEGARVG